MASKSSSVWAIDIGNNSLKALHLSVENETVEVIGFDSVQHGKILSGTGVKDAERDELIAISLRRLIEQNDLGKEDIIISVASQNSFARFVNLPPVEKKRIPEIVKFEASQQIPFDINDVQWAWQLMNEPGEGEAKVGIFAIKNEIVDSALEYFHAEGLKVKYVQMAPMALYNYILHDNKDWSDSENHAIVILDVGAENTDLVVCTKSAVWQRCIHKGGNAFTKAIADAFKLSFERAEKLKRTAAMSKYARQTYQAMRPVFSDLASEIQRSLNFFSSSNPDANISKVIAVGGGTKMRGLLKYLRQSLQLPVERPETFHQARLGPGVSAVKFHESVPDFGVVYGLGLQSLGYGKIESNLLPGSLARSMAWAGKAKYFTVAACIFFCVSVLAFARTYFDSASYAGKDGVRSEIARDIRGAKDASQKVSEQKARAGGSKASIKQAFTPFEYREVIPVLYETIILTLPNEKNTPEQASLYQAFAAYDVKSVKEIDRKDRKQVFMTSLSIHFVEDVETAELGEAAFVVKSGSSDDDDDDEGGGRRAALNMSAYARKTYENIGPASAVMGGPGFVVTMEGYSPYRDIEVLMEPAGVGSDQSKWGVVTRLLQLGDVNSPVDPNSPFMLYEKTNPTHFKLEFMEVKYDSEMPSGIGVVEKRTSQARGPLGKTIKKKEPVLIDPMTKEIISTETKVGEEVGSSFNASNGKDYVANDHWFVLKCKFLWKDAPEKPVVPLAPAGRSRPAKSSAKKE